MADFARDLLITYLPRTPRYSLVYTYKCAVIDNWVSLALLCVPNHLFTFRIVAAIDSAMFPRLRLLNW